MSRIITALVVLPVLIASILISWLQPLFVLLAAAALALGLFEFYVLAKKRDLKPDAVAGYLAAAGLFVIFYIVKPWQLLDMLFLLQAVLIVFIPGTLIAAALRGAPFEKMLPSAGATILGVLYVAFLGGHLVSLRTGFTQEVSADLLSFFFLIIMGADTAAYYVGGTFGKHKLAPALSPGKTWEGVIGGLVASLLLAALAHYWFFRDLPLKVALPLAAVMTGLGILGDLTESALKRGAGMKDTATILPGHGGILDRLDSLLFNAPLIYYFGRFYFW